MCCPPYKILILKSCILFVSFHEISYLLLCSAEVYFWVCPCMRIKYKIYHILENSIVLQDVVNVTSGMETHLGKVFTTETLYKNWIFSESWLSYLLHFQCKVASFAPLSGNEQGDILGTYQGLAHNILTLLAMHWNHFQCVSKVQHPATDGTFGNHWLPLITPPFPPHWLAEQK